MTVKHWIFLGIVLANVVLYVTQVGKPRKRITGSDAAFSIVEWSLLVWLAIS